MTDTNVPKTGRPPGSAPVAWHPLRQLQDEIDRMFGRYAPSRWGELSAFGGSGLSADMDVAETPEAVEVTMDVPGLSESDIDVSLVDDVLTVKGERRNEREEKKKDYHVVERSFGSFQRRIAVGREIDAEKISAHVTKGVLRIVLPKLQSPRTRQHKIAIQQG